MTPPSPGFWVDKIVFFCSTPYDHVGSYRIWIKDLIEYFKDLNITADITSSVNDIEQYKIVICGKNDWQIASSIKKKHPDKKVGVINLAADKRNLNIDFVIVGSLEEMDSLSCYKNVFLYPLIERMYQNSEQKKHTQNDVLRVGYHGHYPHLAKFEPSLKKALERLDKECNLELLIVTTDENINWVYGRPNIKNIVMKKWHLDTVKDHLMTCDIGIVPNITQIPFNLSMHPVNSELGLYNTDQIIRMKNKSNAGRAFVFHQLGIPVVADLTPSNFHIMGNPECGVIAYSEEGWYRGLDKLRNPKTRQRMAECAKKEFDRLYNPILWAQKLYIDIRGVDNDTE